MRLKTSHVTQAADDIALKYVIYLAGNQDKFERFCGQSGLGLEDLKSRLPDRAFQGFLLDMLLQDESELLAFTSEHNLRPEVVMQARSKLPGFSP